jgi:hypothetical protein
VNGCSFKHILINKVKGTRTQGAFTNKTKGRLIAATGPHTSSDKMTDKIVKRIELYTIVGMRIQSSPYTMLTLKIFFVNDYLIESVEGKEIERTKEQRIPPNGHFVPHRSIKGQ